MRLMGSGDHHFDEHSSRFDECLRIHRWMVEEARAQKIDLFVSGGDIYERASTPVERKAVADEWIVPMAEVCPVVIARGNHDRLLDCALLAKLRTKHPVIVEEGAGVVEIAGAQVAVVAWPDRARVLAALGETASQQHADLVAQRALCDVLRGIGSEWEEFGGPRILVGHFMCDGAETSSGQPLLGQPIRVGLSDLALARAHLTLMAHIHREQRWETPYGPVLYTGSPYRKDFSETERKAVTLAEFDGARLVELVSLETPARAMVHLEDLWTGSGWASGELPEDAVRGAEVRFRYRVAADQQGIARAAAEDVERKLLLLNAHSVKLEPVLQIERRARTPEVGRAPTVASKLEAFWPSVGFDPGDRRAALLVKAREVEEACGAWTSGPAALRLESFRFHDIGPLRDFEVDLRRFGEDEKLIAITGPNGSGKSFALEAAIPGAAYRRMPTHGTLLSRARSRESFVEVQLATDAPWRIRHLLDGVSRKGETVVYDAHGQPAYNGTSVSTFDQWARRHMPAPDVLFAAQFAAQRAPKARASFIELDSAERISVILQAVGVARLEAMAEAARKRTAETEQKLEVLVARIDDARARCGDPQELRGELSEAEQKFQQSETILAALRDQLAAAETELREVEAVRQKAEEIAARRKALTDQVRAAEGRLEALQDGLAEARALVARKDEIRQAALRADELRASLSRLEQEIRVAELERAKAVELEERRTRLRSEQADLETKLASLSERIAALRQVQELAEQIRSAKQATDELSSERAELAARRSQAMCELQAVTESLPKLLERRKRVEERVKGNEKVLEERGRVQDALDAVHRLNNAITLAKAAATIAEGDLEKLRSVRLDGAEVRIGDLRSTLSTIADGCPNPKGTAQEALDRDNERLGEAETLPERLRTKEREVAESRSTVQRLERERDDQQRIAARASVIDAAERDLAAAREELAGIESEQTTVGERSVTLGAETAELAAKIAILDAQIASISEVAGRFEELLSADAELRALEPQERDAREELARVTAELVALPEPLPVPEIPTADGLRAELAAASREARVEDLVRAETLLAGSEPQERAVRAEIARLREDLERLPVPEEVTPRFNHAALKAEVAEVEREAKRLTGLVARAEQRLEQCLANQEALEELVRERCEVEGELADWKRLAADFGRDGLQSAEVDSAGPELTELINDLLETCHGPRFRVSVETSRLSADGKKQIDECRFQVIDTREGREGEAREFSGGERVIIGEAASLALTMLACRRADVRGITLVRDESGAALDPQNNRVYVAMLRRAIEHTGAAHLLLVSHVPEVIELCDARIDLGEARRWASARSEKDVA